MYFLGYQNCFYRNLYPCCRSCSFVGLERERERERERDSYSVWFVFESCAVRISVDAPAVLVAVFVFVSQYTQANDGTQHETTDSPSLAIFLVHWPLYNICRWKGDYKYPKNEPRISDVPIMAPWSFGRWLLDVVSANRFPVEAGTGSYSETGNCFLLN